jgi:hypothetical protein
MAMAANRLAYQWRRFDTPLQHGYGSPLGL